MFLQTNDRTINLRNVSNVNILHASNRIVFNLNYNIEIPNTACAGTFPGTKLISDYVYWDAVDAKDQQENIARLLVNEYFVKNFLRDSSGNVFVNMNEISSIKYSEKKHRVIFNLSHPVTFRDHDKKERVTSEFVYVNCNSFAHYKEYVNYVKTTIEGK